MILAPILRCDDINLSDFCFEQLSKICKKSSDTFRTAIIVVCIFTTIKSKDKKKNNKQRKKIKEEEEEEEKKNKTTTTTATTKTKHKSMAPLSPTKKPKLFN